MAFSSPEQDCRPGCLRLTVPLADASVPTLAGERLVSQSKLGNAADINFVLTSFEQGPVRGLKGTCVQGGTSRCATSPGRLLLDPWWSPRSSPFVQPALTRKKRFGST